MRIIRNILTTTVIVIMTFMLAGAAVFPAKATDIKTSDNEWDDWEIEEDVNECGIACADSVFLKISDVNVDFEELNNALKVKVIFVSTVDIDKNEGGSVYWAYLYYFIDGDIKNKNKIEMDCSGLICVGSIPSQKKGTEVRFAVVAANKIGSKTTQSFEISKSGSMDDYLIPDENDVKIPEKEFRHFKEARFVDNRITYDKNRVYITFNKGELYQNETNKAGIYLFILKDPDNVEYTGFLNSVLLVYSPDKSVFDNAIKNNVFTKKQKDLIVPQIEKGALLLDGGAIISGKGFSEWFSLKSQPEVETINGDTVILSLERNAIGKIGENSMLVFSIVNPEPSSIDSFMPSYVEGCQFHMFYYGSQTYYNMR